MAIEGIVYVHAKSGGPRARARQFYGDTPGWKLHTDEPHVAGFWFGGGYLVAGLDPAAASESHRGHAMHVAVRVGDIEAEHVRLTERGVEVSPIQRQPWGVRNFSFRDPDGYLWEYGEPV
jgi:catechol 2,3-dioxygenase-like lactoylglutathione lyase family enzyme